MPELETKNNEKIVAEEPVARIEDDDEDESDDEIPDLEDAGESIEDVTAVEKTPVLYCCARVLHK